MACLRKLKEDIAELQTLFPRTHERFRIVAASVDELSCVFVTPSKSVRINANFLVSSVVHFPFTSEFFFQETYPSTSPLWFAECEDVEVG